MKIIKYDYLFKKWKIKNDAKKAKRNYESRKIRRLIKYYNLLDKIARQGVNEKDLKKKFIKKFDVPINFSVINNSTETIDFFNSIEKYIVDKEHRAHVFLNMENVTNITVDALMFLLAIIQNIKKNGNIYSFSGNLPRDINTRRIVQTSGFLKFLQKSNVKTIFNSNTIAIRTGNNADPKLAGDICDLISNSEGNKLKNTKFLYTILGEMMSNANEHAYENGNKKAQKWLLFVEKINNIYRFIFLDTGLGIIKTIYKNWKERIFGKNQKELLVSAFNGEFRTQTEERNRGKGLPRIKKAVRDESVSKIDVITNRVIYKLSKEDINDELSEIDCNLDGTLYYWEIINEENINDNL